jgi:hypothetical protein
MAILAAKMRLGSHRAQSLEGGADQGMKPDVYTCFRERGYFDPEIAAS